MSTENNPMMKQAHSDDSLIAFTQNIRKAAIDKLMPEGAIPEDTKTIGLISRLADSMSITALANKKVETETKANDIAVQAQKTIAVILKQTRGGRDLYKENHPQSLQAPVIEGELVEADMVPGLLDTHTSQETYEDFMKRTSPSSSDLPDDR